MLTSIRGMLAAVVAALAIMGCDWERHTDDWGNAWWALEAENGWGALKLICLRDGRPSVVMSTFGPSDRSHNVEYRVESGPVISQQWQSYGVDSIIADLHMTDNRWEFVQALSDTPGSLRFRWENYLGNWQELSFADTDGIDIVAGILDYRCQFLSDEPVRNGPSITGDHIDQSCVERADIYLEHLRERQGRVVELNSAAYLEHSTLATAGLKACRLSISYSTGQPWGATLCYDPSAPKEGHWTAVRGSLERCLEHWQEEYGAPAQ